MVHSKAKFKGDMQSKSSIQRALWNMLLGVAFKMLSDGRIDMQGMRDVCHVKAYEISLS